MKVLFIVIATFVYFSNIEVHSSEHGMKVYFKCISCHGTRALGKKNLGAPKLAGQDGWYLEDQIKLIRSGERNSGRSKSMLTMFRKLSEKDIREVSRYLQSLSCK